MAESDRNDKLETYFATAREMPEPASEALMARVLGDALEVQAGQAAVSTARSGTRPGLLAGLFSALGGWPAIAGLSTAVAAGVWIGFSPDLGVGDAMAGALGVSETSDVYLADYSAVFDFSFDEGDAG